MKNLKLTKPIALLLSGLMLVSTFTVTAAAAETDNGSGNDSSKVGQSISEVMELLNATTYAEYKVTHAEKALGKNAITIAGTDYDTEKTDAKVSVDTTAEKRRFIRLNSVLSCIMLTFPRMAFT